MKNSPPAPKVFQAIDDKSTCIGVYADGKLFFEDFPANISKTWRYSASIKNDDVQYAELFCGGRSLEEVCPPELKEELQSATRRLRAYIKSFKIAKINMNDHCFYDLVPTDFIVRFLEIKNKITKYVFDNYEKPMNYDFLAKVQKLLHKIKYQSLNINNKDCKHIFYSSIDRTKAQALLKGPQYVHYNLFGTVTGRLTTKSDSFPLLTLRRDFRKMIKPKNNWFLSLDYNGAEIRTFLALGGHEQPSFDVHKWNIENIFKTKMERQEAKTIFFSWFYNPDSKVINSDFYKREKVIKDWYEDGFVKTPTGRKIKVDEKKAFNYLIQSTTSDLVLERAVAIDELLEGKKSFISHIVHDEIVIDFADEDRKLIHNIKKTFANNQLGDYIINMKAGPNYLELEDLNL